jgi:hypothetical protein
MGLDSRSRATVISCADRCIRRSGGTLRSGVSPAAMPRWARDARFCVSAGNVCDARAQGNLCAPISVDYRRPSRRATISPVARGCSAVGSASPCQGEGRGFESRHPLEVQSHQSPRWSGRVVRQRPAKPCTRVRFPSPPPNRLSGAISSAGERFPDTEEVTGSIPVSRTSVIAAQSSSETESACVNCT